MISLRIIAVLTLLAPQAALAHVVLAEPKAEPGSYYAGFFRVGHGCDGAATIALRITIPEQVASAKPQPKPGWTLAVERMPLAKPITVHGKTVRDRVAAITWRGRLGDDEFDQFGILMKLPEESGLLYFPVEQTCKTGEVRWQDIPLEGQSWHDVPHPAPVLMIAPGSGGQQDHQH